MPKCHLIWFRQDLRLSDNPAIQAAASDADELIPLYIHELPDDSAWPPGAASQWWLHHSLHALNSALSELGNPLVILVGKAADVLPNLCEEHHVDAVFWNRRYEPDHLDQDKALKSRLKHDGLVVESFNGNLLFEPWEVLRDKKHPYRVFTPYWKACLATNKAQPVNEAPANLPPRPKEIESAPLETLNLLPTIHWDEGLEKSWKPGETGAQTRLEEFIDDGLSHYRTGRDFPAESYTSRLSPHLHFGEISPRQILNQIDQLENNGSHFKRELIWREFAHHLLFHFPQTTEEPMNPKFEYMPWLEDETALERWQRGNTGIPIVDAGMRELWHTGWMHNRVRMIVGSLLVKNMGQQWLNGARWFWDTLVDADLANNTLGWQWVAGCGADAAPYFRIFNPVLQGEKFDAEGKYTRKWVPEIASLPDKFLHQPWAAPDSVLRDAGIRLGKDYPNPIVDLKISREQALERYAEAREMPSS